MRITVYGAGAVGLVLGARLAHGGDEVVFLVRRPEVAERICAEGVRFEDPASAVSFTAQVRAVATPAELPQSFRAGPILFCMRASETAAAAAALHPVAANAVVASFQNDLENESILARRYPVVLGAPLRQTCTRTGPNAAVATGGGRVVLGRHPSGAGPTLEALSARLRAAGYDVGISARIAEDRWLKLCVNLMSAPNALIRRPDHTTRTFVEIKARLLEEARAALFAAGIVARSCDGRDRSLTEEIAWQRASLEHGESARDLPIYNQVWSALRHRTPLEADAYHQRILRLAGESGVPAPINARVLEVLLRQATSGAGPESVAAEEILGDALVHDREQAVEVVLGDVERRGHVHDVPERTEMGSPRARGLVHAPAGPRQVAGVAREVERADHAERAHGRDSGQLRHRGEGARDPLGPGLRAPEHALVLEDPEHLERDGGAERVSAEGVAVVEGALRGAEEALEDAPRRESRSHRQDASGQALRGAQQVGRDSGVRTGPHRAGASVAGEDLVEDEQDVVAVAELARCAQVTDVVEAHSGGALHHGFEHDRGDAPCLRRERPRERAHSAVERSGLEGRRHVEALEERAFERAAEELDAAERGRAERLAVEGAFERDERAPLGAPRLRGELQRELHRDLYGRRAVVAEEDVLEARRRDPAERLRELRGGAVRDPRERRVAEGLRLAAERGHEPRVAVAEGRRPPGGVGVEVGAPVRVEEARARGALDHERPAPLAPLLHRRVGVPDAPAVEIDDASAPSRRVAQSTSSASRRSASS